MGRRPRKQSSSDCTPEAVAAMTFEPMRLEGVQSREDFMASASDVHLLVLVAHDLLKKNPREMAEAINAIYGDDAIGFFEAIKWAEEWADGWKQVAKCVEARALIAVSQRALGKHE